MPSLAIGLMEGHVVEIPAGPWFWRAELEADNVGEEFSDMSPPTYGKLKAEAGSTQVLRVLEGSLSSDG